MKKVLLGMLIAAAGLYGYQQLVHPRVATVEKVTDEGEPRDMQPVSAGVNDSNRFHCDGRVYCSEMTSCDEAMYFLEHCPGVKMDGGGDGVPCERQWCGNR